MEELALREGFRDGDLDAWSVLLRECQPMLQRAIASKLLGAPDREDALTAVWEHAWRCRATYDAAYPALPWLLGICIHVCGEARREHTRFRVALGDRKSACRERV